MVGGAALLRDVGGLFETTSQPVGTELATRPAPFVPGAAPPISLDEGRRRLVPLPAVVEDFGPADSFSISPELLAQMSIDRERVEALLGEPAEALVDYSGNGLLSVDAARNGRVRDVDGVIGQLTAFTADDEILGRPPGFRGLFTVSSDVRIFQNREAALAELWDLHRRYYQPWFGFEEQAPPFRIRRVGPVLAIVQVSRTGFLPAYDESAALLRELTQQVLDLLAPIGGLTDEDLELMRYQGFVPTVTTEADP